MSDLAALATTLTAALGAAGAFVWKRLEKRFVEIEHKLDKCEERDRAHHERRGILTAVIELLWAEVRRQAPTSPVLQRADKLMNDLKKISEKSDHS